MKLLATIILTSWIGSLFLPWWIIFITCFVAGSLLGQRGLPSFYLGFLGIATIWLLQISYIHFANQGLLTARMSDLLGLSHPLLLMGITILTGGIVGGLSTLTGTLFRQIIR